MTDNDIPKHDKPFFFVINEDGEMDGGPTLEEATTRLNENYAGNIMRAVHATVHMAPAKVEDVGSIIVPDDVGFTIEIPAKEC
jgi:hypothetical protein